jgi:uncharacterized membrane protein
MIISRIIPTRTKEDHDGFQKSLTLFIIGFFIILIGITVLIVATVLHGGSSTNFGTVIFIGPFPIIIGAGPEATWMILFAIILAVLSIMMFLIVRRELKKTEG